MDFSPTVSQEELVAIRRALHSHAESGLSEFWTTSFLAEKLAALGCEVHLGEEVMDRAVMMGSPSPEVQKKRLQAALEQGADPKWIEKMDGLTGLMVDIRPDLPMHSVLRFDIDCVDVSESHDADHKPAAESFASINEGECHACAHDGHATIGLGVAMELMRRRDALKHNVRLIFEPAEEGSRGALPMVSAGLVDGARYFLAAHIGVNARQDHALVCGTHGFLATTKFDVELFGLAAHSGSDPHKGHNSLLAAATILLNLHALPRHGEGASRVTVGMLSGGTGRNVIPDHAKLVCETRGATEEINQYMFDKAKLIIEHVAAMYEQEVKITIMGTAGNAISDKKMIDVVRQAAQDVPYFHKDRITGLGAGFGTDDACTFLSAVQKQGGAGTYCQIGSVLDAGHHNPRFDFNEDLLQPAVELFCRSTFLMDVME
ncbi:amidohydrolase [uncultured Mailhella sp.]|uniref:amidohydrolase n=1 Tax=uncultured Mailhella sp. TaxID=1981031 RepID=UPI00261444A1|nr:amidohydrolase [uncultured Mailhella sp.]